jgi:hypothetical protein
MPSSWIIAGFSSTPPVLSNSQEGSTFAREISKCSLKVSLPVSSSRWMNALPDGMSAVSWRQSRKSLPSLSWNTLGSMDQCDERHRKGVVLVSTNVPVIEFATARPIQCCEVAPLISEP